MVLHPESLYHHEATQCHRQITCGVCIMKESCLRLSPKLPVVWGSFLTAWIRYDRWPSCLSEHRQGSGAADSLLLVDDNFSWKLLSLRAHSSGSITTEIRDKEIKLDMTTLASGVFRQHPHSFRATSLAETSRMIHLFTCASQNLFQVDVLTGWHYGALFRWRSLNK